MRARRVKLEYDAEVDAAYLTLARGRVVESEEVQPGIILDFGSHERLLGVEILRFSRRFRPRKSNGKGSAGRPKSSAIPR